MSRTSTALRATLITPSAWARVSTRFAVDRVTPAIEARSAWARWHGAVVVGQERVVHARQAAQDPYVGGQVERVEQLMRRRLQPR